MRRSRLRHRLAGRRLRRALQRSQVARRSRAARLPLVGLVHLLKDLRQRARACSRAAIAAISCNRVALRKARINRRLSLVALLKSRHLAQNHGPGVKAGHQQQHQHGHRHRTDVADHLHQRAGALRQRRRRPAPAPLSACKSRQSSSQNRHSPHYHGIRRDDRFQVIDLVPPGVPRRIQPRHARSCYAALGLSNCCASRCLPIAPSSEPELRFERRPLPSGRTCSSNCALKTTPSSITPSPSSAPASTCSPAKPARANPSSSMRWPC